MRVLLAVFTMFILTLGQDACALSVAEDMLSTKDRDGDGVTDDIDRCPGTGPGIEVDKYGCPKDSDEDGLINTVDRCPFLEGDVSAEGCPDRDGDGVEDKDDKCPFVAGTIVQLGCPDIDGDGIIDREDRCPDMFGLASAKGCPDRDYDGVLDDSDKCPFIKGSINNNGCPEVFPKGISVTGKEKEIFDKALKDVKFVAGKTELLQRSRNVLDQIVILMRENGQYNLLILGFTDSDGSDLWNKKLSEKRANMVRNYLISRNIDGARLTAAGMGEADPISSNRTLKGREQNRRIEFRIF